jgi:hypothetical protein
MGGKAMSTPAPAQPVTVENLYYEIGVLSVANKFLSDEVSRLNTWIGTYGKELRAEVDKIEASANADGKVISTELKAVVDYFRSKL